MPLHLHLHSRSGEPDLQDLLAGDGETVIAARDEALLNERLLRLTANGTVWDVRAVTFAGLLAMLRERAGLGNPPSLDVIEFRSRLATALGGDPGAGRVPPLERAVRELRANRVTPHALRDLQRTAPSAALAELVPAYALTADLLVPDDALWLLAEAAEAITLGRVVIAGFDDFAPAQWAVLRALGRLNDVHVFVAYESDRYVFEARHARVAAWRADADRVLVHPPAGDVLERRLFEPGLADRLQAVDFHETAGSDVEHRVALGAVLDALRAGVPPAHVAVVAPRLADIVRPLAAIFAEAGIPFTYETRQPWTTAPIAAALLRLWLFACDEEGPNSVGHLVAWLRSPYSGALPEQVDEFEAIARRHAAGEPMTRGQALSRWDGEAIAPARALRRLGEGSLRGQAAYLVRIGHERLNLAVGDRMLPNRADLLDIAALGALGGLIDQLSDEEPTRRGRAAPGGLGALLADLTIPDRVHARNAVALLDAAQVRGRGFRHVVSFGLESGRFPTRPSSDPYLPPAVRAALGMPQRAPGTSEQRLRFHAVCVAASEQLTLIRRFADDDGRETAPSTFWNEARRLLPDATIARHGSSAAIANRTAREQERSLARERSASLPSVTSALARRSRVLGLGAGLSRDRFRVTELESYLNCAYGWFVGSLLRPQPLEPRFDAAEEGTFAHDVLEKALSELAGGGVGACTTATLDAYLAAVDDKLALVADDRRPFDAGRIYEAFCARLQGHLHLRLAEDAAREPRLRPAEFEVGFRDETVVPGAVLTGKSDRLDISADGRYVVAIDYKRSLATFDEKGKVKLQLPLYSEMAARQRGAESAGGIYVAIRNPAADGRIRDDIDAYGNAPDKWLLTPDAWRDRVEIAIAEAARAIAAIRAGAVPAPPTNPCPPYCNHKFVWR